MILKLKILNQIYELYHNVTKDLDTACKKGCSHCCTCNVTLTTLESYKIIEYFIKKGKSDFLLRLSTSQKRFIPQFTINQFAELCINDGEIPEENNHDWGKCAFLSNGICSIYELRNEN